MGISWKLMVCVVLMAAITGCSEPGMNKKLALSDAIGVAATGATLDQAKDFDKARAEVIESAMALDKFVQDGNISDLPVDKAREALVQLLINKGWSQYIYLVDSLFLYVKTVHLPTDAIGPNNVLLIHTALDGIIRQATRSKSEWAVPWKNGVSAPIPSGVAR